MRMAAAWRAGMGRAGGGWWVGTAAAQGAQRHLNSLVVLDNVPDAASRRQPREPRPSSDGRSLPRDLQPVVALSGASYRLHVIESMRTNSPRWL